MALYAKNTDILLVAYGYVRSHGVQNLTLCSRYGLRPNTLTDISKGICLARGREKYLQAFVRELVRQSRSASLKGDADTVTQITQQLADLMVRQYCPTP